MEGLTLCCQGFNIAHNTDKSVFDEISRYPDREKRYTAAMTWFSTGPGFESSHIVGAFDWESIGKGVIVDVGGSQGSLGAAVVRAFPSLRCIVQDQPDVVKAGQRNLPLELESRVTFMKHDFFEEQPIKAANVYLLRWILHDWSDKYAIQILKALVPALTQDSKVVICEHVLPEPGTIPIYQERAMRYVQGLKPYIYLLIDQRRAFDLAMLEFHNAKERGIDDWVGLLAMADSRYRLLDCKQPPGSRLAVMVVGWLVDKVGNEFGSN